MSETRIPERKEAALNDTWDLASLFASDEQWEAAFAGFKERITRLPSFKGTLSRSTDALASYLVFYRDSCILEERLACYAELRQCEDESNSAARTMTGKIAMAQAQARQMCAWATPEIQAIPDETMHAALASGKLEEYIVYLKEILRWKPYILSEEGERIVALESENAALASDVFSVLTNVDLDFGTIETPQGALPLSQSTWSLFMEAPERALREKAYRSFYARYETHKTALAALLSGSVKQDVIKARVRGFGSAREAALFPDNVSFDVYDNLINTVSANLAPLHRYYRLKKEALGVDALRHYDVYAPLVQKVRKKTTWEEAVAHISNALAPLGTEYVETLRAGLTGRWADKYENKGKHAGAFSSGSWTGKPYILMNYKEDSLRDVFTLAHEGGHSMHSYYASGSNPFMHYNYSIFEAEVASTFNEELLFRYLMQHADSAALRLFIVGKRADDILATLYRQTMFAEFEKITHELEEQGIPLTVDVLRENYRALLEKYFGSGVILEPESDLEGLRIPHFYRAFYVYKYATGISASLALAERVLKGGDHEREDYFTFLKSGGSRFPIEALKCAGVDMSSPEPVSAACRLFGNLVDELAALLEKQKKGHDGD